MSAVFRMWAALGLLWVFGSGTPPVFAGDVVEGLKTAKRLGCLACHNGANDSDRSAQRTTPFISGQNIKYLRRQLATFQTRKPRLSGKEEIAERHHPLMELRGMTLTETEIDHLATYYSKRRCPKLTVEKVERPKKAERCAFCHGDKGVTPFIAYPHLAGQKEKYLATQLRAMRSAAKNVPARNRRFHRLMAPQVIDLTNQDIQELARYYSAQTCSR